MVAGTNDRTVFNLCGIANALNYEFRVRKSGSDLVLVPVLMKIGTWTSLSDPSGNQKLAGMSNTKAETRLST